MRAIQLSAVVVVYALVAGCGRNDGLHRVPVEGSVTFDGKPLAYGSILFLPCDGSRGPKVGGIVRDGRYSLPAAEGPIAGPLRVEVRAPRIDAGKTLPDNSAELVRLVAHAAELVPTRYNLRSELEVVAQKNDANRFDFELVSGKLPPARRPLVAR